MRISSAGPNALRVFACPEDMDRIKKYLQQISPVAQGVLVDVGGLEVSKAATTLSNILGDPTKGGGPYIEAMPDQNGVLVHGSSDQVQQVRDLIKVMNGESAGPTVPGTAPGGINTKPGAFRVITLDKGSGAAVADKLKELMEQMRPNPVRVTTPGGSSDVDKPAPAPAPPPAPPAMPKLGPEGKKPASRGDVLLVSQKPGHTAPPAPLVDPQEKKNPKPEDKKDNTLPPVTISAFGNKIIIASDDPAVLAMAQQLLRLITQTTAGEGDFEVIHLHNANAVEAAKLLDQAFNGPKPTTTQQPQGPGGFGRLFQRFAGQGAAPEAPANPQPDTIRIVADPATNSLLVKAKPVDLLTIRYLLSKDIDYNDKALEGGPKTRTIGPLKYARAEDMYDLLSNIYHDQMDQNPTLTDLSGRGGFARAIAGSQNRNLDASGQPRAVTLKIAVDDQTNSLLVNSTESLYTEINDVVQKLDLAAKNNSRTYRIVQLKDVDPIVAEQIVDAIQGRTTVLPSTSGGSSILSPTNGFQPGGGGFQPGGGGQFQGGGQTGGPGRRRGGQRAPDREGRGPDFFEGRVMDDPQPILFDPQHDASALNDNDQGGSVQPVRYQEPAQPPQPPQPPGAVVVEAPRTPVTAIQVGPTGQIILSGPNAEDVNLVYDQLMAILATIPHTTLKIEFVPLKKADAAAVASTLSQLYTRVIVQSATTTLNNQGKVQQQTQQGTLTQEQLSSVVLIPVPRLNALIVAAPESRMAEVKADIAKLDVANTQIAKDFHLKRHRPPASPPYSNNFYNTRYSEGNESSANHSVRITFDTTTNELFVQASPGDMTEIEALIAHLDTDESDAVTTLRIRPLYHTAADDIATLLQRAISYGVAPYVVPTGTTTGTGTGTGTTPGGGFPGAAPAGLPRGRPGGTAGGGPGAGGRTTTGGGFPGDHHARHDHHDRRRYDRRDHDRHGRGRGRHHQEHDPPDHRSENGQGHRPVRRAGRRVHPSGREQQQPADSRPGEDAGPAQRID